TDMAAHLEANPAARAVVNFAPILLEQLEDYALNIEHFFDENAPLNDWLLRALVDVTLPHDEESSLRLLKQCLKANETRLIQRFEPFQKLVQLARHALENPLTLLYVNGQFLADLLVWYHIAWLGESVRNHPVIKQLMDKKSQFGVRDREQLLRVIGEAIRGIIPRYRRLLEQNRVELSFSPYSHPIIPLMIDFKSAEEAMPGTALPAAMHYPNGEERAHWHIQHGIEVFERYFGQPPTGCWPSEGSISDAALKLFAEHNVKWIATGQQVLRNSLNRAQINTGCIHRPYRVQSIPVECFFRDDQLSDAIGFHYSNWHADDAVNDLIHTLENINNACLDTPNRLVPIILDGENCWEYYPNNGHYFLQALYAKLSQHPKLNLTTFKDYLATMQNAAFTLPSIMAGSWVYGTFSTWIGCEDKNRGWDLLVQAKQTLDTLIKNNALSEKAKQLSLEQLALCEGSDWFWWFGDYNPSETVHDFERLYREHLINLYRFMGQPVPEVLSKVISRGHGNPENSGVMRRSQE
ncbi:MAG TPA: glycoside hydrolase family 57 protein, partial [Pseudomonadales bacterium]|nr:glycoside hydrolase family 57 protein [Pseudomonadales bacterium]